MRKAFVCASLIGVCLAWSQVGCGPSDASRPAAVPSAEEKVKLEAVGKTAPSEK